MKKQQHPWDLGNKACCGVWASCKFGGTSVHIGWLFHSDWILVPMWIFFRHIEDKSIVSEDIDYYTINVFCAQL